MFLFLNNTDLKEEDLGFGGGVFWFGFFWTDF